MRLHKRKEKQNQFLKKFHGSSKFQFQLPIADCIHWMGEEEEKRILNLHFLKDYNEQTYSIQLNEQEENNVHFFENSFPYSVE